MNELGRILLASIGASQQGLPVRGASGKRSVNFSETFKKASAEIDASGVKSAEPAKKAERIKQPEAEAKPDISDEAAETDVLDEPHKKRPKQKGELPDELAALAGGPHKQIIPSPPAEDVQTDTAAETAQVVSILESNMEIEVQVTVEIDPGEFEAALAAAETGDDELTARMPQKTGQVDVPENEQVTDKNVIKTDVKAENSSPLENTNNIEVTKTQTAQKEAEGETESDSDDNELLSKQPQTVDIAPERFAATESMSKAAAPAATATATPETLMSTIVDNIEMINTSESKFMEISLKPEFLGKVAIQLSLSDGGLEIRIKADDNGVKTLLAGQLSQLTESLESKGVKITSVDVVQTNVTDHTYEQSQSHGQGQGGNHQPHGSSQARTVSVGFGIGFTEEPELVSVVDTGQSSVEYTA